MSTVNASKLSNLNMPVLEYISNKAIFSLNRSKVTILDGKNNFFCIQTGASNMRLVFCKIYVNIQKVDRTLFCWICDHYLIKKN